MGDVCTDLPANTSMTSSTCRLRASSNTAATIFSIHTAISQSSHFCSWVVRLLQAEGE